MIETPKGNRFYKIIDFLHTHIVGVIVAVVVISCALSMLWYFNGIGSADEETEDGIAYEDMSTLYFGINSLRSLNPLSSQDEDVYYISQLMYSSLFRLDDNLNIEGDAVESYDTDYSKGSVTITLRSGIKFSDDSKLTTDDVRFTINQIDSIGKKSPYYAYTSKISSVSISSERKMTIYFSSTTDAALDNLVFPIVSSNDYTTGDDYKPVGSGPYRYSSYDSTDSLNLKPNKNYYGDVPSNNLKFKILPDISAVTGLMTIDSITAYVSEEMDADSDAQDKELGYNPINSNEAEYLGFNFENQYLSEKKVREAIALAIDTETIISDNYGGTAILSDSIYYPNFLGTENKGDAYPLNQSKAASTLRDAGFADVDEDGVLEDGDKKDIEFKLIVNSNNTSRVDAARSIAEDLNSIGLNVSVSELSWKNYEKALKKGDYDLVVGGYKFDKQYNLKELFNSKNVLNYTSEKIVSNVNKLEGALTSDEAKATYEELKADLEEELPYYCLCYKTYSFVTAKKFQGESTVTFFDRYRGVSNWTWKRAVVDDTASDTYDSSEESE